MGKDYPSDHRQFCLQLKNAFRAKSNLTNIGDIENAIAHGEYVKRELETLYKLRVYREMKRRYYDA